MASPLDRAFVEILPDFSKFVSAFRNDIDKATTTLESRFDRAFARVERMASVTARNIAQKFHDAFAQLGNEAAMAADDAEDELDDIDVPKVEIETDVDERQLNDEVDDAVRRARPPSIPIDIDLDREGTFSRFLSSITGVRLPIAGFISLGAAVGAAAAAAVQFAAAMAPAVGIITTLPSGIGILAAGMTTLSVATMGVGDAFAAAATGDAEEFEAAMEGLAPSVQEAAQAIRDMMPALEELRNSVQGAFFEGFNDMLNSLAETLLGPVTTGMTSVATSINGLIMQLANVATSAVGVEFVNQSFSILAATIDTLSEPLTALFGSLLSIGTVINEAFGANAGEGLANLITQFAAFLDRAAASGEAVAWVENAITVFEQLGAIIAPIVSIISSIGDAARATGGNILGVFGEALETFASFLETGEGMSTLISIFETFNAVGALFGDILEGIGPALPPLIDGIGALVGAIAPLIPPLAIIVGDLLVALAPLLGLVAQAISPLIGPLTTIAGQIGGLLVTAIQALMPWIEMLLELFSGQLVAILEVVMAVLSALLPVFAALTPIIEPLLQLLTPFIELFAMLAEILAAILVPVIELLGGILLWLVETVIVPVVVPVIEFLAGLLEGALGTAINWVVTQFQAAGEGLKVVWEFIKNVADTHTKALALIFNFLVNAFKVGWNIINNNVFTPLKNGIAVVKNTVIGHLNTLKTGWDTFVNFIKGIDDRIAGSLRSMFNPLVDGFKSAINAVIDGWNSLSFSIPSVDIPGLGTVGGGTINTPNIPRLRVGGMSMGEGLASLDPNEAILPLEDNRTTSMMSDALAAALENLGGFGPGTTAAAAGDITVRVYIGDREITDIIDTRIDDSNREMMRRARSGTGRNR